MQRAGGCPINNNQVSPGNRSQPVQIEVGIAKFQGIKGPLNEPDSPAESFFTLEELQQAAHAAIAIIACHAGHVGMEIRHALPQAGDRQRVADHAAVCKCTQHLRAWALANSRLHAFPSASFVASHRVSISSRERFLNSRPDSRARASIARTRRENFRLAFLSAISGSTSRNRARFTAANSRSPISSSICRWPPPFNAVSSSAVSSCILATTPAESSQSKPIREALRVS